MPGEARSDDVAGRAGAPYEHSLANEALRRWYADRGFGGRVGFGRRPAILAIDVGNLWTDPEHPEGSHQERELAAIVRLLDEARASSVPIVFTTMGFAPDLSDCDETVLRKLPQSRFEILGTNDTELHPAVARRPSEHLLVKKRQSAFFGTPLISHLVNFGCDTTIVVGFSTSGCIRSTCESAFNHSFRVIVPDGAVGDRCRSAHEAALFDIDNRFGDVVAVEEVVTYLRGIRAAAGSAEGDGGGAPDEVADAPLADRGTG